MIVNKYIVGARFIAPHRERNNTMFKLILLVLALVAGYMVLQQLPDLQRYMRIRAM
jgi:hypothetical protein